MATNLFAILQPAALIFLRLTTGEIREGNHSVGKIGGEIQLVVTAASSQNIEVRLIRLGLFSTSLASWQDSQGELGLSAQAGIGSIRIDESKLELNFDADVRYAERTEKGYRNLEVLPNGSRVPRHRKFTGTLVGSLQPKEGATGWLLKEASLHLQESSLGKAVAELGINLQAEGETAQPPPCPEALSGTGGTLQIRSIVFRDPSLTPIETGETFKDQLARANDVWGRCCIRLDPISRLLGSPEVRRSGEPQKIAASVAPGDIADGAVSIFFVEKLATGDGGGTLEGNTIIIDEDSARANPFLLAHELGHIMGLVDVSFPDIMQNDVIPKEQPPNSAKNCGVVTHFEKIMGTFSCCWEP